MNVAPPPGVADGPNQPAEPPPEAEVVAGAVGCCGRIADILLGKVVTLVLAALAFAVGLATFIILARGSPFGLQPGRRRRPGAGQSVGGAAARSRCSPGG